MLAARSGDFARENLSTIASSLAASNREEAIKAKYKLKYEAVAGENNQCCLSPLLRHANMAG